MSNTSTYTLILAQQTVHLRAPIIFKIYKEVIIAVMQHCFVFFTAVANVWGVQPFTMRMYTTQILAKMVEA